MKDELLDTLREIVGETHLLDRTQVQQRATHFWDASPLVAKALVRPANTEQTSQVLAACHEARQVVVTHGGVTGLVDGNRSTRNDIILSLERQRQIEKVDPVGRTIVVQAGAVLQDVQQAAMDAGLQLGLDLGARGSCTIGGNVATNAGGLSVLRYGMTREQVLGLEVVLADGTVISAMNSMMKNNAGYDLKHMFIGSEGTLGIITRVILRLRAATPDVQTALLAFNGFTDVSATLHHLDSALSGTLDAFEVIWQPFYRLNTDPEGDNTVRAPLPRDYPIYAVVDSKSSAITTTESVFQQALEKLMEKGHVLDAVIAQSRKEAATIWYIREHIDIALRHDPVFVYDISLPIADMERYVDKLQRSLDVVWPECHLYVYGHLADGNLHVLVAPPADKNQSSENNSVQQTGLDSTDGKQIDSDKAAQMKQWHHTSNRIVYEPLQALGGSVSAEHGIGLLKKPYLPLSRNAAEISLMKTLKRTLDPGNILNRGKILDLD